MMYKESSAKWIFICFMVLALSIGGVVCTAYYKDTSRLNEQQSQRIEQKDHEITDLINQRDDAVRAADAEQKKNQQSGQQIASLNNQVQELQKDKRALTGVLAQSSEKLAKLEQKIVPGGSTTLPPKVVDQMIQPIVASTSTVPMLLIVVVSVGVMGLSTLYNRLTHPERQTSEQKIAQLEMLAIHQGKAINDIRSRSNISRQRYQEQIAKLHQENQRLMGQSK